MIDLISREALLDEFRSLCGPQTGDGWDNMGVRNLIMRQKAVDAVPVIHGRWVPSEDEHEKWKCSVCGCGCWYYINDGIACRSRFCPTCGAKMDGSVSE